MTGRVPLRSSITSAPHLPSARTSASSLIASARYTEQFHALLEHQRRVHTEERALWHTERSELYDKISGLEATLSRYQAISTSMVSSPVDISQTDQAGTGNFWCKARTTRSQQASTDTDESGGGSGDEVWRGPKPERKPSRTFSDSSQATGGKAGSSLPSIAEDTKSSPKQKPSISVNPSSLDANLDGIRFRTPSLAVPGISSTNDKVMTPQSPSPISPGQSPSHLTPQNPDPGELLLPKTYHDPYTKDAGHTPLARSGPQGLSVPSSTSSTPKHYPETERPPLAPHTTQTAVPKPPSERRDSYFPSTSSNLENSDPDPATLSTKPETETSEPDPDPALLEPLTLSEQENAGDTRFLNELDSRLLQAARAEAFPASDGVGEDKENQGSVITGVDGGSDETGKEADGALGSSDEYDEGPTLRIKRSMNFGSQLGSGSFGRGF